MHLIIKHGVYHVFDRCRKSVNPKGNPLKWKRTCLPYENDVSDKGFWWYEGYVFWNTCPRNWSDMSVRQKCQDKDKSDLLHNLPVFDYDSHMTYRNIFCARCNGAVNTAYWRLQFDCFKWFNTKAFNFRDSMDVFNSQCEVRKIPSLSQQKYLKRCIPRFDDCLDGSQDNNKSYCQTECLRYAFPICVTVLREFVRFRNPQCALCNGIKPWLNDLCRRYYPAEELPALTILFDFSSTSKYSIVVDDKIMRLQTIKYASWSCAVNEVYDPYTGKCKMIVSSAGSQSFHRQNRLRAPERNTRNETGLRQSRFCIPFNQSDYEQLPNGTVYIRPHNKIYSNTSYTIYNDKLLLCVNFSRNATATVSVQSIVKTKTTAAYASLQILTSIGCIVSMVSLVLLLITYILFAELRNLPGKIIINLALSLLVYQAMFFSAVKTPNQEQCLVIAVLLHFFVLSSFTWMNVVAYDVHRTFTTSGKLNPTVCISYIHIVLLIIRIMEFLVVLLLKRPNGMSLNRVMNDHVNVPIYGFVGNSLDLTSPPVFYLQERGREDFYSYDNISLAFNESP